MVKFVPLRCSKTCNDKFLGNVGEEKVDKVLRDREREKETWTEKGRKRRGRVHKGKNKKAKCKQLNFWHCQKIEKKIS